jgi:hypothetical protein
MDKELLSEQQESADVRDDSDLEPGEFELAQRLRVLGGCGLELGLNNRYGLAL